MELFHAFHANARIDIKIPKNPFEGLLNKIFSKLNVQKQTDINFRKGKKALVTGNTEFRNSIF